ncbi:MAG: hypothetical protein JWM58_895 [Rhizobium sp.]|nr:hypothetical protein [Rhizobium sp.]
MHKFKILKAANDQFRVQFLYNSEVMVWSENYASKASARNCIESIKKNAPGAATVDVSKDETGSGYRFEIVESKDGEHFVRFRASNGERRTAKRWCVRKPMPARPAPGTASNP